MNGWMALLRAQRWPLFEATAAHLDLVVEAILIAAVIAVPLGIVASRFRSVEWVAIGLANIFQTIPGLALLGILLVVFRGQIGKPPALAALVVYSLLPILKNTILGLKGVDRGVIEAAVGMGMTWPQRLAWVELPLAVAVLLGGVRVAAVAAVGLATIASAIGARGLGSYIYAGIEVSDTRLILLGSIPAAILALICDAALGSVERWLDPTRRHASRGWLHGSLAIALTVPLLSLAGFGAWRTIEWDPEAAAKTIIIGSKDSPDSKLLAHMLADLVEARTPLRVDRRFDMAGTLFCFNSLREGAIDAYVEYTGTALTTILKSPPAYDPSAVRATVKKAMQNQGIDVLSPLGFENTFAILMRREQASRLGIAKISDLANHLQTLKMGFGPEFGQRDDGFPGLAKAYDLAFSRTPVKMNRNLLYQAVAKESIDVAAGDSTDGRIATYDLVMLQDDRRFFPPYEAVPLVRTQTLGRHPGLLDAMNGLADRIDSATMRQLNNEVDREKRDPGVVAREFLNRTGLLKP